MSWIRDGGSTPAAPAAGRFERERIAWAATVLVAALAGLVVSR